MKTNTRVVFEKHSSVFLWYTDKITIDSFGTSANFRVAEDGKTIGEVDTLEEAKELAEKHDSSHQSDLLQKERKEAEERMIWAFFHEKSEDDRRRLAYEEFVAPKWNKRANRR